ncbi:MAG: bifunctional glutamate N-acetyltransferase/amino-acid acetyltransferase ArgJ, partial [Gammaproteobacteria bacterium]
MASSIEAPADGTLELSDVALGVAGIRLGVAASGTRYRNRNDLCLIELAPASVTQCLFTTNRFCAAPVIVARRHLAAAAPRYLVTNAGNANAGTGEAGIAAALQVCAAVAAETACPLATVLPFSTGVIGQALPAELLGAAVPALVADLRADGWHDAAAAIMTTDTRVKLRSARAGSDDLRFTVTGMAKGSGMIKPDMATMLGYVATDAAVSPAGLQRLAVEVAGASFNRITVDGDTSTNDALAVIATGAAGNTPIEDDRSPGYAALRSALEAVCVGLAQDIVRDGEGATKFVTVRVAGGHNDSDCRRVAYAVAESPLVKTALFASDANWGRILAAVGRAGADQLAIDEVDIDIGPCAIVRGGEPVPDYDEAPVARAMKAQDIDITIRIGQG